MVLLGRIKVSVTKRRAINVADRVAHRARNLTPPIEPATLFVEWKKTTTLAPGRFKVIGNDNDQMHIAVGFAHTAHQFARTPERITREPGHGPRKFR